MNPHGLDVDVFVSHYWAHPFARTHSALSNYAESIYQDLSKQDSGDVVYWVCLFALNQHNAAAEVGSSPELGPFNAALAKASYGAVMVLDSEDLPLTRAWCQFEVKRAKDLNIEVFELVTDEGPLAMAGSSILEAIGIRLCGLRTFNANTSREKDKLVIQYGILNDSLRRCSQR